MKLCDYIQQNESLNRLNNHLSFCLINEEKALFSHTISEYLLSGDTLTENDIQSFLNDILNNLSSSSFPERRKWELLNIFSVWGYSAVDIQNIDLPGNDIKKRWLTRFFDYTKRCEETDKQKLWCIILCQEMRNPGSFFIRTLDLLDKAEMFEVEWFFEVTKYVIDKAFIPEFVIRGNTFYAFNKFQTLVDFGLINPIHASTTYDKTVVLPLSHAEMKIEVSTSPFVMNVYILTDAGSQLYALKSEVATDVYLDKLKEHIERNKAFIVSFTKK